MNQSLTTNTGSAFIGDKIKRIDNTIPYTYTIVAFSIDPLIKLEVAHLSPLDDYAMGGLVCGGRDAYRNYELVKEEQCN